MEGFTYSMNIYSGKTGNEKQREVGLTKKVYEHLAKNLLNEGRILFVDNFYMSYDLARDFI